MILRSIEVRGWKCFADAVTVGPFGERINVIHAPNAVGKSTLLEALYRGFFDGHRVGGRDAEMMRPWGRDLAPEVALEFAERGTVYRLKKRFLDSPSSELLRQEGNKYVRLAEGEKADEAVRSFFSGASPGRGLSKPSHWGLAQVLLVPQGHMDVPELSGNLVADIQHSLGAQVSSPGTGPVEQKIEAAYLRFLTPTGKLKTGKEAPRVVELTSRMEELEKKQRDLLEALEAFENLSRRVEDLRARRAQAKLDAESLDHELGKARRQAQSYAKLMADRDLRGHQVQTAAARHAELKQRVDNIGNARTELAGLQTELERLRTDIAAGAKEMESLTALAEAAKAHLDEVRKGRAQVDRAEKEGEDAQRYVQSRESHAGLEVLLQRIREAAADVEARRREHAKAVAPDAKTLRAIRKGLNARDEAQVRLDAALITLEIVPQVPGRLEIISAEQTGQKRITPGTTLTVKGAPEVVVDLEGVARIRARGPAGTVEELRDEVNKAARKVEALTAGYGTAEIDELEALSEQAQIIQQSISDAQTRLETLLSGNSIEQLEHEHQKKQRIIEEIVRDYPGWSETPPDADSLRNKARAIKQGFIEKVDKAELRKDKAEQAQRAAIQRIDRLQTKQDLSDRRVKAISGNLDELQRDGMDDQKRADLLKQISLAWDAAKAALEEAEKELAHYPDDPRLLVEKLERQIQAVGLQASNALEQQKLEEGRLQQLALEGPYSALSQVEEAMAGLRRQIEAEELRLNAVRLLWETVVDCRSRVLAGIRRPVEESATRILQRIAGTRLGGVQLADRFQPQAVRPRIATKEIDLIELSGGEKEQVHLAVRLALAEVLAGDDRRFIVLDDILTATDTGRLARILSIIEEAAQRLQLFVLTCHPERYRGMGEAHFFDLEEIVSRGNK